MKKTIAALVAVSAAAGLALAQPNGDEKGFGGRHGRRGPDQAQLLEKFDANKNGVLDPEEKEAAKSEWQAHRKEREAKMLERFDANRNGVLDPEEKEAARTELRGGRGGHGDHKKMLEKFDANHDGTLDPQEREAMRAKGEARRAEMLKKYDTDGDGKLSDTERETLRKDMREKHNQR
jgi:Ca2+-binding EF-hand superfamily protein